MTTDAQWMQLALEEAREAQRLGEVPIGCVLVVDGAAVSRTHNLRESLQNPLAHAECLALEEASRVLGRWRLSDATLYVTLEPCAMCAGALVLARVPRVVFGAADSRVGAVASLYRLLSDERLNHRAEVVGGVCAETAAALLKQFFQDLRGRQKAS